MLSVGMRRSILVQMHFAWMRLHIGGMRRAMLEEIHTGGMRSVMLEDMHNGRMRCPALA